MFILYYILIASFIISLLSFIGVVSLILKSSLLDKILLYLVAFSTGTLLGGAFLHLLPEAGDKLGTVYALRVTLASFIFFFIVEKILHWRHCHDGDCSVHTFGYINLFGDAIHNFIDGLILAGAFVADFNLGIATSIALAFHEVPQEIGDLAVLIYAGFSKRKAIVLNFVIALTAVAGALVGYKLAIVNTDIAPYFLPLAAGGFIYIATSDLIPEIRKENNVQKSAISFILFFFGMLMMTLFV